MYAFVCGAISVSVCYVGFYFTVLVLIINVLIPDLRDFYSHTKPTNNLVMSSFREKRDILILGFSLVVPVLPRCGQSCCAITQDQQNSVQVSV